LQSSNYVDIPYINMGNEAVHVADQEPANSLNSKEILKRKQKIEHGNALAQKLQDLEARQYQETRAKVQNSLQIYIQRLDTLHRAFEGLMECFHKEKLTHLIDEQPQFSPFTEAILSVCARKVPENATIIENQPIEHLEAQMQELRTRMDSGKGANGDFHKFYLAILTEFLQSSDASGGNSARLFVYLPVCKGQELVKWRSDHQPPETIPLSRPVEFTPTTMSLVLPDGRLFLCGGQMMHGRRVLIVNIASGEVSSLPDMRTERISAGLAYAYNSVFAFGGFSAGKKHDTGEKHSFQRQQWTPLQARMANVRYQFSPFAYHQSIYIAGGYKTTAVEVFDIPSETFYGLPLVLPAAFATTCFVHSGELVVLQKKCVIRWQLGQSDATKTVKEADIVMLESSVNVQMVGKKAYYSQVAQNRCELLEVDLATFNVAKKEVMMLGPPCEVA